MNAALENEADAREGMTYIVNGASRACNQIMSERADLETESCSVPIVNERLNLWGQCRKDDRATLPQASTMIRSLFLAVMAALAVVPAIATADPGTSPRKASKAASVDPGHGVVVVSVRSAIFLDATLNVYFLREGGSIDNDADVFRFSRKQGLLAIGNDTTDFAVKTFQLPAGRYHLVAHGVRCPKVPEPGQTCSLRVEFGGANERVSRPSKGYEGETPAFEVVAGSVTYAGDFALDPRNRIMWSEIPDKELGKVGKKFGSLAVGPDPVVPLDFYLVGELNRRGMFRDSGRTY